jgi:hypothetical protein
MSQSATPAPGETRVEEHLRELAERIRNPRLLAGSIAGTSEETAALFNSGHTLADDNTGPREEADSASVVAPPDPLVHAQSS